MPPVEIVYNSFSASLKSPANKRRALIAEFSQNCLAGFDGHVIHRIFILFLQLATQHFVTVAGCKTEVLHVKSSLQLVSQQKVATKVASCNMTLKAMLHEAIFLATCLATNVARQVARKISRVTPPATATKCRVASCKKSRNILNFSQRCETSCCV